MKKQTKVLLAAALFTLGASFSSMAALKNGTWVLNEEGWQYVDKEGEYVEEEWCLSYGTEYWVNDEGVLGASEWVTDSDGHTYYVQSDGSKTISAWKYIFAEDDEDADEESWFYFDAKGRMVYSAKKTIGDYTYYFDSEGKMLTGWVEVTKDSDGNVVDANPADSETKVGSVVFCDENGALVKSSWIHQFPFTADADECYEGEDEAYYYAGSNGSLYTTKKNIDGLTYFFNKVTGQMQDGWIIKVQDGTKADGTATYAYTSADAALNSENVIEAYWTDEVGYAKKNTWKELDDPTESDTFWYYFDKLGRAFLPNTASGSNVKEVTFEDGESNSFDYDTIGNVVSKKIDGVEYFFNNKGEMLDGLVTIDNEFYYLNDGAKQTGKVSLTDENENDYDFYFATKTVTDEGYKKAVAVNGNMDGYCYKNGQLIKSEESGIYKEVTIGDTMFVVDYRGKIQHKDGKEYDLGTAVKKYTFNTTNKGWNEDCVK